jgi:hypothetical protein
MPPFQSELKIFHRAHHATPAHGAPAANTYRIGKSQTRLSLYERLFTKFSRTLPPALSGTVANVCRARPANGLRLGQLCESGLELELGNGHLSRHTLIIAPNGVGGASFLEHLMVQQVAQGGGLLVLDQAPHSPLPAVLMEATRHMNRANTFLHWNTANPRGKTGFVVHNILRKGLVGHVTIPYVNAHYAKILVEMVLQDVQAFVAAGFKAKAGGRDAPPIPFMLVLPRVSEWASIALRPLILQARRAGIAIVLQDHSIGALYRGNPALASAILANTNNKLFLKNPYAHELDWLEHQFVGPFKAPSSCQLKQLANGEAYLLENSQLHKLRLCHLKK